MRTSFALPLAAVLFAACGSIDEVSKDEKPRAPASDAAQPSGAELRDARETHLGDLRQLTFGGQNAEAYFSADGQRLVFQAMTGDMECDQIFTMGIDGSDARMVSTGKGVTTCGYFLPGDRLLYSSTHLGGDSCPPKPDRSMGYVWPVYAEYDVFSARADGSDLQRLTATPGYDAETTLSPDGKRLVFTSVRDGDLELYSMNVDGSDVVRLTHEEGYDGGAFFSPDSKQIVWRAHHPQDEKGLADYRDLLARGLVRPSLMDLFVMNADGSDKRRITDNGAANFCPYFTPDGRRIIFSSNLDPAGGTRGREFDLFLIDVDGKNLEQVTFTPEFDGFPMFSPDGKKLVFASNRGGKVRGETNIFIADWK
jgi:Tol biopolymer transport system component